MDWLLFVLIAVGFSVLYSLISKALLNTKEDYNPIAYAFVLFTHVALVTLVVYLFTGGNFGEVGNLFRPEILPWLVINLLAYTLAPSLFYRALKRMPISEVSILYVFTSVYVLIINSFLLKTIPSEIRIIGAVLIVIANILVSISQESWRFGKYFLMMIGATLFYAVGAITDSRIIESGSISNLLFQLVNFGIPAFLLLLVNRISIKQLRPLFRMNTYRVIVVNAVFFFVYFYALYRAYSSGGDVTAVNLIFSSETVILVILSALLLKERQHFGRKLVAGIIVGAGVFLLSQS